MISQAIEVPVDLQYVEMLRSKIEMLETELKSLKRDGLPYLSVSSPVTTKISAAPLQSSISIPIRCMAKYTREQSGYDSHVIIQSLSDQGISFGYYLSDGIFNEKTYREIDRMMMLEFHKRLIREILDEKSGK